MSEADDRRRDGGDRRDRIEFDLPTFLTAMRAELNQKIDNGFAAQDAKTSKIAADLASHELADTVFQTRMSERLSVMGDLRKSIQWIGRTAVAGLIVYAVKVIFFK